MQIPSPVRLRAVSEGNRAEKWLLKLPNTIQHLQNIWQLADVGQPIQGGSESIVLPVKLPSGEDGVIKMGMPQVCDIEGEARILKLADGKGYATLFQLNKKHNAMLIERLGPSLADANISANQKIKTICQTLKNAWIPLDEPYGFTTGAQKAQWLAEFIDETWKELEQPCTLTTRNQALDFAEARAAAYDANKCVLVHGDAHEHNTLATLSLVHGTYKFVDPDGLFAEPACDLAVPMRGFNEALLEGDVNHNGVARCFLLSELTAVNPTAIWQWGFMERVSTGLLLLKIGLKEEGQTMLKIADQWAKSGIIV